MCTGGVVGGAAGGAGGGWMQRERETAAARGHVRVAAAADLNQALVAVIAGFGARTTSTSPCRIGSSGTFHAQLLNQAPFDLFLSADLHYPNELASRGRPCRNPSSPTRWAAWSSGRLPPSPLAIDRDGFAALTGTSITHLAIANPGTRAPYGRAAVAAMQSAGVYDRSAAQAGARRECRADDAVRAERRRRTRRSWPDR